MFDQYAFTRTYGQHNVYYASVCSTDRHLSKRLTRVVTSGWSILDWVFHTWSHRRSTIWMTDSRMEPMVFDAWLVSISHSKWNWTFRLCIQSESPVSFRMRDWHKKKVYSSWTHLLYVLLNRRLLTFNIVLSLRPDFMNEPLLICA